MKQKKTKFMAIKCLCQRMWHSKETLSYWKTNQSHTKITNMTVNLLISKANLNSIFLKISFCYLHNWFRKIHYFLFIFFFSMSFCVFRTWRKWWVLSLTPYAALYIFYCVLQKTMHFFNSSKVVCKKFL